VEGLVIGVVSSIAASALTGFIVGLVKDRRYTKVNDRLTALEAMNAARVEVVAEETMKAVKESV